MQKFPLILDLETQHTFREFDEAQKLRVSVAVIYDYAERRTFIYRESALSKLFPRLEKASYVVGYNSRSFDMQVLQAYYPGDLSKFPQFDILEDIRRIIGRRVGLNDVASATLDEKKSGHGLLAIEYFKEGKWDELEKYCQDDVMVTKRLFEYGIEHDRIFYRNETGKVPIRVDWRRYMEEDGGASETALTLPF